MIHEGAAPISDFTCYQMTLITCCCCIQVIMYVSLDCNFFLYSMLFIIINSMYTLYPSFYTENSISCSHGGGILNYISDFKIGCCI